MNYTHFVTERGIPMVCRVVFQRDSYGRDGCLFHEEEEPFVEFYDNRFDHNPWLPFTGQFVSRYYLSTFLEARGGICLDGGIPEWTIYESDLIPLQRWVKWRTT